MKRAFGETWMRRGDVRYNRSILRAAAEAQIKDLEAAADDYTEALKIDALLKRQIGDPAEKARAKAATLKGEY